METCEAFQRIGAGPPIPNTIPDLPCPCSPTKESGENEVESQFANILILGAASAYMGLMRRLSQVLFVIALSIQFASGAHLLDHHQEWERKCESSSKHFCSDVSTHDASLCAICLVCAGGLTFDASEIPQSIGIATAWVLSPELASDLFDDRASSSPRGPPSLLA